jgi:two-component system nitrogen regulation sensor histidine kinase GlnL
VVVLDTDLGVDFINPAAETLLSVSESRAVGHALQEILDLPANMMERLRAAVDSGQAYTDRGICLGAKTDTAVTVNYSASRQQVPELGVRLIVELTRVDHHMRIAREEALIAQQQATRSLVRGLAHEIKNPLGGLRGAAQLLEKELPDAALREYTQIIIGEADRLRNLMNRMLGPNRRPNKSPVNIHEITEHVRQLIAAEAGEDVRFITNYDPSIPQLEADRDWLIQGLLNIARNALQALDGKGEIIFKTRALRQFTIGTKIHRLVAEIQIIDDGPGIPEDMLETLFYPMITGRSEGTGLGLSIAQSIVNQHGGVIECISQDGKTAFTVLLPLVTLGAHE